VESNWKPPDKNDLLRLVPRCPGRGRAAEIATKEEVGRLQGREAARSTFRGPKVGTAGKRRSQENFVYEEKKVK